MSSRGGGYGHSIDVKADFRMWRGDRILTQRQRAELVGHRQASTPDLPGGWQPPDIQATAQAGASY